MNRYGLRLGTKARGMPTPEPVAHFGRKVFHRPHEHLSYVPAFLQSLLIKILPVDADNLLAFSLIQHSSLK